MAHSRLVWSIAYPRLVYTVFLRGLEFYAYHGVPEAERAVGHRYAVDLEVEVTGRAIDTDAIEDTVDYALLGERAVQVASATAYRTVERLAAAICEAVLENFPLVLRVRATVVKRLPPANLIAECAGVVVARERPGL